MKARKHPRVYLHCEVNQANVDKLRVLAEEEASLFGDSQDHRENREAYLYALDELVEKLQRQQVMAFQFRNDLTVDTGKEYFDKYLQFLQIIHSDHQGLQRLKDLFGDCIDFHDMEVDRYACGSDFGSREQLYLRSTSGRGNH